MNRSDRHINNKKLIYQRFSLNLTIVIVIIGFFSIHLYLQSLIKIEAPNKELGRKVIVEMPNGKDIYTYEKLIVKKEGKVLYKGERNTIDLTGGKIIYNNWK
ncbi:hypothetical protein [Bacillus massilinigeriensis]|uniref:hypothetical protein n=1 Tax=Bacillus massilionigeriensis TaxID=1805475 RepID=UPI00096B0E45|nr:hypothetical protein [Bacillus massilionigeriensis]